MAQIPYIMAHMGPSPGDSMLVWGEGSLESKDPDFQGSLESQVGKDQRLHVAIWYIPAPFNAFQKVYENPLGHKYIPYTYRILWDAAISRLSNLESAAFVNRLSQVAVGGLST